MKSNWSWGSDPEFVFQKNGKICSAIGFLKGDKEKKTVIAPYEFYYDNVLGECTLPPTYSKVETVDNIRNCLQTFSKLIAPCELLIQASHKYDQQQLNHEDAFKVYCVAESCCYSMMEVERDEEIFHKTNLRSAGGHIHLGAPFLKKGYASWTTARLMDLFLGIPSVFLDQDPTSKRRKDIYGKAGRFRITDYGIEYRSLGNFWLASPRLVELIYDLSEFVLAFVESGLWKELWFIDEAKINDDKSWLDRKFDPAKCHQAKYNASLMRKAIDTCDKELAKEFMIFIKNFIPKEIYSRIETLSTCKFDFKKEWDIE